jgi:hypothetical protein
MTSPSESIQRPSRLSVALTFVGITAQNALNAAKKDPAMPLVDRRIIVPLRQNSLIGELQPLSAWKR